MQYLNPDLNDTDAGFGASPLRLLEQTCSKVGKPDVPVSKFSKLVSEKSNLRIQSCDKSSVDKSNVISKSNCPNKRAAQSMQSYSDVGSNKVRRIESENLKSVESQLLQSVANNCALRGNYLLTPQINKSDDWSSLQRAMLGLQSLQTASSSQLTVSTEQETRSEQQSAKTDVHVKFTCQWLNCGLNFASIDELSGHLSVHVNEQSRSDSQFSCSSVNTGGSLNLQHHDAHPRHTQQFLTNDAMITPRTSSSTSSSPATPLSLTPPPTTISPINTPQNFIQSYPNSIAAWLKNYIGYNPVNPAAYPGTNLALLNTNQPFNFDSAKDVLAETISNYLSAVTSVQNASRDSFGSVNNSYLCSQLIGLPLLKN